MSRVEIAAIQGATVRQRVRRFFRGPTDRYGQVIEVTYPEPVVTVMWGDGDIEQFPLSAFETLPDPRANGTP